jgi:hypothetical protein
MKFIATEAGFKDGLGGASNGQAGEKYHYVLFGKQRDAQHPENTGIYFEFDNQRNGAVNSVKAVRISEGTVIFTLKRGKAIEVNCNVSADQWEELQRGLRQVFPKNIFQMNSAARRVLSKATSKRATRQGRSAAGRV